MSIYSPIGNRFLDYSNVGIHTHYRIALLLADAESRQSLAGYRSTLRGRIGEMMITLGVAIAGTTHDLQERRASMPTPSRKPGFSPTR